ncbi:ACP S-malonyltransferase [Saccharopolyspora sp. NFXS83]|uniref:ACP S-malonyltransferase n=1 Tax=Saccharopolyspora sp. NFXS83 TaxID=2993560 RepID=UPI00224B57CA|nr:ACP S-malonyltransferase [Saccharopolyspora sp. NFXS83]MCX2729168.1 ACP S-malonyltransferase [Saccharopolyspora sp. NFXS83]
MAPRTIFLFAGQGSQYHHMGRWYYENDPVFRATMDELDEVVRRQRGDSVLAGLYAPERAAEQPLAEFRLSHPSIFMVEFAAARMLRSHGFTPDAVLGASLGEIVAAAVAGAVDPAECLSSMLRQVELFESDCPRGGMLAVLGGTELLAELPTGTAELAAVNSASNFVLSGMDGDLDRVEAALTAKQVLCQRLPVPFPFHSSYLDAVREPFTRLVRELDVRRPAIPVVSGTTGEPVAEPDADHLWQVLRAPFDLPRALDGVLTGGRCLVLDLGPAGSMANAVRARLPAGSGSVALPVLSPYARDEVLFSKVLAARPRTAPPAAPVPKPSGAPEAVERSDHETEVEPVAARPEPDALSVYVFPGQGSQRKGMGRELFDRFPELTALADEVVGYSMRTLCVDDPQRRLRSTEFTQPALYVVNALTYLAALQEGGRLPDYVLGHSLGEYDALFAAGVFDFETGLRLVRERGLLMSRAPGGRMAAVSGLDAQALAEVLRGNGLAEIDVANLNTPTQTVIAGPAEAIDRALPLCTAAGGRCAPLNVSAPFHSRYMAGAAEEFGRVLDGTSFAAPKIPVISNVDARPHVAGRIGEMLRRQIDNPVRWTDGIRYLMGLGRLRVRELGPGQVLTKLVAKIEAEPVPTAPASGEPVEDEAGPSATEATSGRSYGSASGGAPVFGSGAVEPGSAAFRRAYGTRHAYAAGGMHHGIASIELVARMARAGLLSYFGARGLPAGRVADAVDRLRAEVPAGSPLGLNLTHDPYDERTESELVDLMLRREVRCAEVSSYVDVSPALVRYRLSGSRLLPDGLAHAPNKVLAKVTRPDVARAFMLPAPTAIVDRLVAAGDLTEEEAAAGRRLPVAGDVCLVGDCGDHTDLGVLPALLPSAIRMRDELVAQGRTSEPVRVGGAGGIGSPEAAAAAFVLGADFVLTGSMNLATAESAISDAVKDLLQTADVHDTAHAPFGELFELGGRARVLKKGTLFHARAGKLYDLWRHYGDWAQVPPGERAKVEKYLGASFEDVCAESGAEAGLDPKRRMALVFRWYCEQARRFAISGKPGREPDYQISCGPALGAGNRWLRGTELEHWRHRHVDELADRLMAGAAAILGGAGEARPDDEIPAVTGGEAGYR